MVDGVPQERDSTDRFATHFLVRDRTSDRWCGTARLITSTQTLLPVQRLNALDPLMEQKLFRLPVAEVSRLAAVPLAHDRHNQRGLLRAVIAALMDYSQQRQIPNVLFLIAPALARVLRGLGLPMTRCGPVIVHRGKRCAFSTHVATAMEELPWARELIDTQGAYASYAYNQALTRAPRSHHGQPVTRVPAEATMAG